MNEYTGLGASSVSVRWCTCSLLTRFTHGSTAAAMETAITAHTQNALEFQLVM